MKTIETISIVERNGIEIKLEKVTTEKFGMSKAKCEYKIYRNGHLFFTGKKSETTTKFFKLIG